MFYKGRLRVAGDPGEGIPVDLSVDDVYVDLRSDGEMLGRWRMDVVEVSRLEGNDFRLLLDGEDMVFQASDPLGFAYNAVATIDEISSRLRKRRRGLFRRRAEPDLVRGEPVEEPAEPASEPIGDLDSLLPSGDRMARPPAEEEPFFEEFEVDFDEEVGAAVSFSDDDGSVSISSETERLETFDGAIADEAEEKSDEQVDLPVTDEEDIGEPSALPLEPADETFEIDSAIDFDVGQEEASDLPMAPPDVEPLEPPQTPTDAEPAASEIEGIEADAPEEPPTSDATAREPGKGKRRGLLRRGKTDHDHVHQYAESRTVGGITRRVCSICGHVSFAGEDVYEDWNE